MREINYKYSTGGMYITEDNTKFEGDTALKINVEPHEFSIAVSGETLRSTCFDGGSIVVTNDGEATFYDKDNALIGKVEKGDKRYEEVRFVWKEDFVSVQFGEVEDVDNYPNCDGEHDRWSTRWDIQRKVVLTLADNSLKVE